jgi:hypothetical protein
VYPDSPHDAEALIIDPTTADLFIVTKEKGAARLYRAAGDRLTHGSEVPLELAGKLGVDQISAGAISSDGRRLILRREDQGWLWTRAAGDSVSAALAKKPTKVEVLGKRQGPNGESISFTPSGDGFFTVSEGKKQAIYRFDLGPATE